MIVPQLLNLSDEVFKVVVGSETEIQTFDFTGRMATGETIVSSAHAFFELDGSGGLVTATGLTLVNESESGGITQLTLSASAANLYVISALATTTNNRVIEAKI